MKRWHQRLSMSINANELFMEALESQLPSEFEKRTGLDLESGKFALMRSADIRYDAEKVGHISTDLVGPGVEGWWVEIAWRCEAHPGEEIAPSTVGPDCTLRIWWGALPDADIHKAHGGPIGPPWPKSDEFPFEPDDYPFRVEWWALSWPDLFFEIISPAELTDGQIHILGRYASAAHAEWNHAATSNPDQGVIHNMTPPSRRTPHSVVVHADFGSAGSRALVTILDTFRTASEHIPIATIVIRGAAV